MILYILDESIDRSITIKVIGYQLFNEFEIANYINSGKSIENFSSGSINSPISISSSRSDGENSSSKKSKDVGTSIDYDYYSKERIENTVFNWNGLELLGIGNYYDKNVSWKIKFLDSRIPSNSSSLGQFFILDQVVWNANDLEK